MPKKRPKVTIISRESNSKTIDVRMLEEELARRGVKVKTLCKLLTKDKSLKSLGYIGHVIRQEAAILGSDVVVLDTYCIPASMIPHSRSTKVVQMWHALAAIKKFGWQTVGMKDGSSRKTAELMRMHEGYDYVIAASDITAEHFCEGFRVGRDKIVKAGLPRIDYIKSVASGSRRADVRRKLFDRYPQLAGSDRQTILYVPTFRRNADVRPATEALVEAVDKEKYNVVIKLHPLYRGSFAAGTDEAHRKNGAAEKGTVIFDDEFISFDWLAAADFVISDYSSLVVEATVADKPLFLYVHDIDEYRSSTGLNVDFDAEPIAPYVFKNPAELAAAIEEPYDMAKLIEFRGRYIDIDIGSEDEEGCCTAGLADFIESLARK